MHYPEKIDSKFRYVLLASARADQLMRGAPPRAGSSDDKVARIAMEEIRADVIEWGYGPEEEAVAAVEGEEVAAEEVE